jgi:hypothetical protein
MTLLRFWSTLNYLLIPLLRSGHTVYCIVFTVELKNISVTQHQELALDAAVKSMIQDNIRLNRSFPIA